MIDVEKNLVKFTATICGWSSWHIGTIDGRRAQEAIATCKEIRDRINADDKAIFNVPMPFLSEPISSEGSCFARIAEVEAVAA